MDAGTICLGTACAGAACALKERMEKAQLSGTIRVYGCPAEEIILGKIQMNQVGVFEDLDAAITWHPFERNRVMLRHLAGAGYEKL